LLVNGLGWIVSSLQPYLYPEADLGFIFVTFFGELVFMLWLLIRGWKLDEVNRAPSSAGGARAT
jgi:hypothetical protein